MKKQPSLAPCGNKNPWFRLSALLITTITSFEPTLAM